MAEAVCVWDVNDPTRTTSKQLVLRGHTGRVSALAALDGGRIATIIASAGEDKDIRIWNVAGEAATPVATLQGHKREITCLAALDGDRLASGNHDGSVIIWNLADGTRLATLEGNANRVICLAALDGDRLASGGADESIIIWNLADGTQLATLEGHTDAVFCLAALDGGRLASGSDGKITIWNLADGAQLARLESLVEGQVDAVNCLAVLDGDRLASGIFEYSDSDGPENSVIVWNLADGAQLVKLKGHTGQVHNMAALDGDRLASGSDDQTIIIWNVAADSGYELLTVLPGHSGPVHCLAVLDDGRLASSGAYRDEKAPRVGAINDSCKEGIDRFGSRPLAGAIVEVVEGASPPVCVGLYAKWGRGKSFLIHQIKQHFDPTARVDPRGGGQIVQDFEPGYDKLKRAFTDKAPPKKAVEPSRSTCGKVLDFISNALFYLLTLTLWWFYKRETVITIIDTVAETFHALVAIGKDLRDRAGMVLSCCSKEYVPVSTDDIESSGDSTARETIKVNDSAFFVVLALTIAWLAALITFCVLYPVRSAPYSYVLIAFFVASLPVLWLGFLTFAAIASEARPGSFSHRCGKCTQKFCCSLDFDDAGETFLVFARVNACSGVLWALVCLYVSLLPSLRSEVIGLAATAGLLAALFLLTACIMYAIIDLERETTSPKPAVKREYVFVDFNASISAQI